jgi:hypothetical protein
MKLSEIKKLIKEEASKTKSTLEPYYGNDLRDEDDAYEAIVDFLQKSPEEYIDADAFPKVKNHLLDLYNDGKFKTVDDIKNEIDFLISHQSILNRIKNSNYISEKVTKSPNSSIKKGDITMWNGKKYKVGEEDKEIKNFYLLNMDGSYAENPNGSKLMVHKNRLIPYTEEIVKEGPAEDEKARQSAIKAKKDIAAAALKSAQELSKPGAKVAEAKGEEDVEVVDDYELQSKKDAEDFTSIDDMEPKITVNAKDKIKFKKLDFLYKEKIGIDKQIKSLVNDYKNKKGTSAEQEIVIALKDMNSRKKETEKLIYQLENELI